MDQDLRSANRLIDRILDHDAPPERMLEMLRDEFRAAGQEADRELLFLAVCAQLLTCKARLRWEQTGALWRHAEEMVG